VSPLKPSFWSPPSPATGPAQATGPVAGAKTKLHLVPNLPRAVPAQLDNIKAQLDLVLVALEALTGIGSEAMLAAANALGYTDLADDRVTLWRLRQSNPLRRGSGGRKKLDVEEALALVMIICYLASQHQAQVRQAVGILEHMDLQHTSPSQNPILGDFLDAFVTLYQERMNPDLQSAQTLEDLALKLLIDLLFYSGEAGPRRLWLALLDRSPQNQS
jgi:hypothetical protein